MLPDPVASSHQATVAVIRVLAEQTLDLRRGERPDISEVSDAVDALLDQLGRGGGVRDPRSR